MVSVAPPGDALTIRHSSGQGLSMLRSVFAIDASDTVNPSVTRSAASRRFSGVIRLSAPNSSSAPHRPQLDSSSSQASYWARLTSGGPPSCPVNPGAPRAMTSAMTAPHPITLRRFPLVMRCLLPCRSSDKRDCNAIPPHGER